MSNHNLSDATSAKSEMRYFVRGCATVPKLGLYGQVNKTEAGQKTVSRQIFCSFPFLDQLGKYCKAS